MFKELLGVAFISFLLLTVILGVLAFLLFMEFFLDKMIEFFDKVEESHKSRNSRQDDSAKI